MSAILPIALQLLPLIPSLVDHALKIIDAVQGDPATPEETKAELDALATKLRDVVERVKNAPLPRA